MNPSLIIAIALSASVVGALTYSYHIGRTQGENICNEEKLQAQLEKTKKELEITEQLSEFQQEQIGEAHFQLEQERIKSDQLKIDLEIAASGKSQCVPDSVLEQLRKFRQRSKNNNS